VAHGVAGMRFAEETRVHLGNSAPDLFSIQGDSMKWSQPAFEDMRFGFEITMYISNR
jgi:coenzyme PQQ precursor peptide PqqA